MLKPNPAQLADRSSTAVKPQGESIPSRVLRIKLAGANPTPQVEGLEELPGKVNYFIGNDPMKWRRNVPIYAKIKARAVYPGVDLVYYGNQRQLEYDFIVAQGADPASIKMAIVGADKISLNGQGDLILAMKDGQVRLQKPVVYQEVEGVRREISGSYRLQSSGQVGFHVGRYDRSRPLVIDPVLAYSTYLGGSGSDGGNGIAVDAAGNAYVTGSTVSTDFPTTAGAFKTTVPGGEHAFVTKLNASGSALVYSTYLGGDNQEQGYGIAVDSLGQAYVTGSTRSVDFPTTAGALQTTLGYSGNAFVTKLDTSGSALLYSSYLGGPAPAMATGIAVHAGNAYVTGQASSNTFPTTAGAFQTTFGGGISDAFVVELNTTGSSLVYSVLEAILNRTPPSAVVVNPDLPTELERRRAPVRRLLHNQSHRAFGEAPFRLLRQTTRLGKSIYPHLLLRC